jgi:quaternary ammonium compound-resistance protein SugE
MAWVLLVIAGLFEIGWAVGLKYTDGFTRPLPTVLTIAAMVISMGLLGVSVRTLPVGTAYAVWTGIGAAGTGVLGIVLFKEPATAARLACMALILSGIVGLRLTHR